MHVFMLWHMHTYVPVFMLWHMHVAVRGQLMGVDSLLLPCGF